MKIGMKLTLTMILLSLFIIGSIGITLLVQIRADVTDLSHNSAVSVAHEYAKEVSGFFSSFWDVTEALAGVMENYDDISMYNRRSFINTVLNKTAEMHSDILGIWVIWEPDVLEGNDLEFLGTPGTAADGRFSPYWFRDGPSISMITLTDYDTPQAGNYYLVPKANGDTTILNPFIFHAAGTEQLITVIARPIFENGSDRILGVLGINISINELQKISQSEQPFGNGLSAIFSTNGIIAGHFDPSRLGTFMQETERDMAGPYLDDFLASISKGELFYYTHYIQAAEAEFNVVSTPIVIGDSDTTWSYAIAVPTKTVFASVNRMQLMTLVISVAILIIVIPAAIILSLSLSRPIIKVVNNLKDIAEGEGDLTRTIAVNSKDEIGELAHYFNQTIEKIKNLIIIIKKQAVNLSDTGTELSSNMTETAAAVNEITANVQSIKGRILNQSASVTQTNATMEQVTFNIHKLNDHVEDQSSNITQASSAIEEMVANIQSVTQTLVKNSDNVKDLIEASDIGRAGLQDVASDIQEIARESEGLLEINAVMQNIASQTNLLSMNAAIEAAHAGDAGRGFAVVADEIRKLAENSGVQSKTISAVLKKIKESIDKITASTENVLSKFMAIDSSVRTVVEQEESIRNAMEEQGEGSKQLLQGITNVNDITRQVKNGSNEMLEGSTEVIREGKNLEKVTQEITGGINEMASGANQINVAVNRVNEISTMNRDNIDIFVREVSKFKVE
jgi:methyl-accepting chemotaxis protein